MKTGFPGEHPLVLIVDDDQNMRLLTRAALEPAGFKIAEAEDGPGGLAVFGASRPEIVLLDVVMPLMDGFEVCARLRLYPGGERVPIVMLTAMDDLESIERAYEAGATDFMTKPINWSILSQRIRYMVRAGRAANELRDLRAVLEENIDQLRREITSRILVEQELKKYRDQLEELVKERTADLMSEIAVRRQTEQELTVAKDAAEAANRTMHSFLSTMSHELNTPLNAIIGFTQLILEEQVGSLNAMQKEYLGDVLGSGRQLASQIADILNMTKLESGKMAPVYTDLLFKKLVKKVVLTFEVKAREKGIEVTMDLEKAPEVIVADKQILEKVLTHLLSNAIKFTQEGGKVHLCASSLLESELIAAGDPFKGIPGPAHSAREYVQVSIRDNGVGIEFQDLERIFNPFEQSDASLTRKFQGTGLGLTLAKKLIELHAGKIWAVSEGNGKGSTFRFILPNHTARQNLTEEEV